MAFIKESSIQKVFDQALVEEVIGKHLELKKAGSNYKALSPFTQENSPSFMVSPAKQIWKCFSTGKGGSSAVSFLREYKNLSYPEAIKELADQYNIQLEFEESKEQSEEERSFQERCDKALTAACNIYKKQLGMGGDLESKPLNYLKVNRGYSEETIIEWEIGYAPDAWDTVKEPLITDGLFNEAKHLGLIRENESGKRYDFFRSRIMFPIHNERGELKGFGGRILSKEAKPKDKYFNSPESDIYNKSAILYGLHLAKQSIRKNGKAYLVEGYTDVISMHQAGIKNTVATCGTSLTDEHVKLLKRFTKHVVILRDGDVAGRNAANRDLMMLLKAGMRSEICILPKGEDPDSICKRLSNQSLES